MIPLSILDLAPVVQGSTPRQALINSLDLARHGEKLGFKRFWLAEHHNMTGIASAATSVVIAHVAAGTSTIRVGAGGIMLPNHSPLVIAEQFGTLATLYPGRIDLGLGRAPGTDQLTARAMRRDLMQAAESFPQDVVELLQYLEPEEPGQRIRAVPGMGTRVPVWILGSSLYGAQLAAILGLPYAFASHFAPAELDRAAETYRARFQPSQYLEKPHFMAAMNVIAADTDDEAVYQSSSLKQAFINIRTGKAGPMPPPVHDFDATLDPQARMILEHTLACTVVGSRDTVRAGVEAFARRTQADEIIVAGQIFDHAARLRSFEILAGARDELARAA